MSLKSNQIIELILDSFRSGAEEIYQDIIVPEVYWVYLNKTDYDEIVAKTDNIVAAAKSALSDEVRRLNHALDVYEKGVVGKGLSKTLELYDHLSGVLRGKPGVKVLRKNYQEPLRGWQISINPDTDENCPPGTVRVKSISGFRKPTELAGHRTMRIVTMKIDGTRVVTEEVVESETKQQFDARFGQVGGKSRLPEAYATIYLQTLSGRTPFKMTQNTFTIGRGGASYWVDLPISANDKISHEHLRIERDKKTGEFFVKDLSRNGTKLNGKKLPSSIERVNGSVRETDTRTSLPDRSTLLLAGEITVSFERTTVGEGEL